jgi:hypothetical protein
MNPSVISALAALAAATIGGLTSVLASWLGQHAQARAHWLAQDKVRRQELYKEFIEAASKCNIHALQHDEPDIPGLVELYAKVGRMRILSSPQVVESAELVARRILDTYLVPNKTFFELRDMTNNGSIDLLREFTETCRAEFESLRAQFWKGNGAALHIAEKAAAGARTKCSSPEKLIRHAAAQLRGPIRLSSPVKLVHQVSAPFRCAH